MTLNILKNTLISLLDWLMRKLWKKFRKNSNFWKFQNLKLNQKRHFIYFFLTLNYQIIKHYISIKVLIATKSIILGKLPPTKTSREATQSRLLTKLSYLPPRIHMYLCHSKLGGFVLFDFLKFFKNFCQFVQRTIVG